MYQNFHLFQFFHFLMFTMTQLSSRIFFQNLATFQSESVRSKQCRAFEMLHCYLNQLILNLAFFGLYRIFRAKSVSNCFSRYKNGTIEQMLMAELSPAHISENRSQSIVQKQLKMAITS